MIKYVLFITLLFITACSSTVQPDKPIEVRTIEVLKPTPIVPQVDTLQLRDVKWVVLTPDNVDTKFSEIENGEAVFFALTVNGYENIALNLSDIRSLIEQQKSIIAIYESQYKE